MFFFLQIFIYLFYFIYLFIYLFFFFYREDALHKYMGYFNEDEKLAEMEKLAAEPFLIDMSHNVSNISVLNCLVLKNCSYRYRVVGCLYRRYKGPWYNSQALSCTPIYLIPPISQFLHKNSHEI